MRAVAERRRRGLLTCAKALARRRSGFVRQGGKRGALVRAVTERLAATSPAGAPPIGLAGLYGNFDRATGCQGGSVYGRHAGFLCDWGMGYPMTST